MGNLWQKETNPRAPIVAVLVLAVAQFASRVQTLAQGTPSGLGDAKDAPTAYALLEGLAKEAVTFDENLGHKRVSISSGIVVYDFKPARSTTVVSRPDRLTTALEILIRAGALDRDFRLCLPTQVFWVAPLDHIRSLARKMVDAAYKTASGAGRQPSEHAYEAQVQAEFAALERELLAYADKAGLNTKGVRGSVEGYNTAISIDPPGARVRFMSFLTYRKCLAFNLNLNDYWLDLTAGSRSLIGKYHYLAEWPSSLSGPVEGNFDVDGEGATVTFSPLPKRD